MRGRYLAFEGIDGSGKTTQSMLLAARLREAGKEVVQTMEPGSSLNSFKVRELLLSHKKVDPIALELLFEADRAEHTAHVVKLLNSGIWVVSDRCYVSGLAYGLACGHPIEFLHDIMEVAVKAKPDVAFVFHLDPYFAAVRREAREAAETREEVKDDAFLQDVAHNYDNMTNLLSEFLQIPLSHHPARDTVEDIAGAIWQYIQDAGWL